MKQSLFVITLLVTATLIVVGCGPKDKRIGDPKTKSDFAELVPPTELKALDTPSDGGKSITLSWKASSTENTPRFLIQEEKERQKFIKKLSPEEEKMLLQQKKRLVESRIEKIECSQTLPQDQKKNRINALQKELQNFKPRYGEDVQDAREKEIEKTYSQEPRLAYEVYMQKQYPGLMGVMAGFFLEDPSHSRDAWEELAEKALEEGAKGRNAATTGISALAADLENAGMTGLAESLNEFVKKINKLTATEDQKASIETFRNTLVEIRRAYKRSELDEKLVLLAGDLSGAAATIEDEEIKQHFTTLLGPLANSAEATTRLGIEVKVMAPKLTSPQNTALLDNAVSDLEEEIDSMEKGYEKAAEELGEAFFAAVKDRSKSKTVTGMLESLPWVMFKSFPSGASYKIEKPSVFGHSEKAEQYHYVLVGGLADGYPYRFKVDLVEQDDLVRKVSVKPAGEKQGLGEGVVVGYSKPNYFDFKKMNLFIVMVCLCTIVILFINLAKKNPNLFIRKISGLDAVDEAIGRATEMGKPIYYITGLGTMELLPTIASINILGRVARRAAKYDTEVKVPCYDPIVMTVAQEVVKEAFQAEGRLDSFKEENVFFVTQDQFSYVAAVDGMMVREKPATNFLLGLFYAESLLLSEAGAGIGAIQIAGTDALPQLPFFITTTDYTLIGEELYAASAYLSRDPMLLGSLRGQDIGKAVVIIVIIIGAVLGTFGIETISYFFK